MQIGYVYPHNAFGSEASLFTKSEVAFGPGTLSVKISGNESLT